MESEHALAINEITEMLRQFNLPELAAVCERIHADVAGPVHPGTLLNMAWKQCLEPLRGEDRMGGLDWRIGPHDEGLPKIHVELVHQGATLTFATKAPISQTQMKLSLAATPEAISGWHPVLDYMQHQITPEDRRELWKWLEDDGKSAVLSQQAASRIRLHGGVQAMLPEAVLGNHRRAVSDLLELGADPNVMDAEGDTLLHLAARAGNHEMMLPLLHAGAWVDAGNHKNQTALHLAAERQCGPSCLILLAHGADPKREDVFGRTPIPKPFPGYEAKQGPKRDRGYEQDL